MSGKRLNSCVSLCAGHQLVNSSYYKGVAGRGTKLWVSKGMCNVQRHVYTHVAAQPLQLRLKPVLRGDLRVIHTIKEERKRSGCCRFTHDTLGEKPFFFFFSPQRLTKNIFKNYSLLLTQRFLLFPCETLLLQYVYSIGCTVQYMKGSTLYCTGLSSEQSLSTTANFSAPARL